MAAYKPGAKKTEKLLNKTKSDCFIVYKTACYSELTIQIDSDPLNISTP